MPSTAVPVLQKIANWQLNLLIIVITIVLADTVVILVELLLLGDFGTNTLKISSISGLVVAGVVVSASSALRDYIAKFQRLNLEQGMARAQSHLSMAVETAQMLSWELDLLTGNCLLSQNELAWMGVAHDTKVHSISQWLELVHPDDQGIFMQRYQAALLPGAEDFSFEYRVQQASGDWGWVHSQGRIKERNEQGIALLAVGGTLNINRRKQAEAALAKVNVELAERNRFLLELMEAIPIPLFYKDAQGLYLGCNHAYEVFMRCHRQALLGRGVFDIAPKELAKIYHEHDLHLMAQGGTQIYETQVKDYADVIHEVIFHKACFTDSSGQVCGLIGGILDITDRKEAETGRARLLKIIEESPDFIAMFDMQARLKHINLAGAKLIGLRVDADLSRLEIKDIQPQWATRRVFEEGIPNVLRHGFWRGETALLHLDGHETAVSQVLLVHRDASGNPEYLSTIIRDISELKNYESKLIEAKQDADAANLAKSRFLATMSHEIRTPMNGILGMAQLLLKANLTTREYQDYARTILSSGQLLLTLLNDILDLSKIEAGKFQLSSVDFEPEQLLHETQILFASAAQIKHLQLNHQWHGTKGQRYRADAHRLRQMLSNLVGNAIKFTAKGKVGIEGSEVGRNNGMATLEFSVSDSGIGIAADKIDLLFKPFSQTDSSITREFGGSGLGLSIVHNLAQAMGGEVGVDSVVGKGSRFWFRLQAEVLAADQDSRKKQRDETASTHCGHGPTSFSGQVLVVEDNPVNCMVIEALLSGLGLTSTMAYDGQQALEALVAGVVPDLILMDIHMPVMDGYAATQRIRQWRADPHLPIIALTADAFDEDRQRCLAAGMDDFLTKPIGIEALKQVLARWLPQKSQIFQSPPLPAPPLAALDQQKFVELVTEIMPLLAHNKFSALYRLKELQVLVTGTRLEPDILEVGELLQTFRFDLALERLRSTLASQTP